MGNGPHDLPSWLTNDGPVESRLLSSAAEVDPCSDAARWRLVFYAATDLGFVQSLQDYFQGRRGQQSSANAPVIFFDGAPTMGNYNGVMHIALSALRFMPGDGRSVMDGMMVAHLRTNFEGLMSLKAAIEKIELTMLKPVPEGAKN